MEAVVMAEDGSYKRKPHHSGDSRFLSHILMVVEHCVSSAAAVSG